MKHICCVLLLVFSSAVAFSQSNADTTYSALKIPAEHLEFFIDSLQQKVLSDRIYFDKSNLFFSKFNKETKNRKPYSSLFVINKKYIYNLDIVESAGVGNFVYQYLDYKKISSIMVLNKKTCGIIYGSTHCTAGAILITLKKGVRFDAAVAGLKKKTNNNFMQDYKDIPVLWQ